MLRNKLRSYEKGMKLRKRYESVMKRLRNKLRSYEKGTKLRKITKLRTSYEVTNIVRSYEKGTKRLRDSNATYRDNLLWRIVMHYGEMPRAMLGSSDLRSQVAIFGEWNIYGTRKILLLNFKPVTRIWKKLSSDKKLKNNKKTNCPKFIDIQWNKGRNSVGTIRAWRHVILSFIHQRQVSIMFSLTFQWYDVMTK